MKEKRTSAVWDLPLPFPIGRFTVLQNVLASGGVILGTQNKTWKKET